MKLRTVALWATLGMATSTAGALALPNPTAPPPPGVPHGTDIGAGQELATTSRFTAGQTLLIDGRLGHSAVPRSNAPGQAAETFLFASVTGADSAAATAPPMNLAIVIDRSGSMKGARIANALDAAVGIVGRMREVDRVTVVAFDTTASIIVAPTSGGEGTRPFLESAIRGIRLGADTCISCGLQAAMAQLSSSAALLGGDHVDRMILLSDGEANHGVTDVPGLRSIAARMRDRGCSITTMGVDVDFDERVMAAIASESNGHHYFVQNASSLPAIFAQEFETLVTTVAQNGELEVHLRPGVQVDQVFDRSFRREGDRLFIPFGAFSAKQEKTVLMKLRVPADREGLEPVAAMTLRYRDLVRSSDVSCEGALALMVTSDASTPSDLDPFVAARINRSETAQALTTANTLFAQGKVVEAEDLLARRRTSLHHEAARASDAAKAAPVAAPAHKSRGAFATDFDDQIAAVSKAEANFAPPPPNASAGPTMAGSGSGAPAQARAAKAATRENQATATEMSF